MQTNITCLIVLDLKLRETHKSSFGVTIEFNSKEICNGFTVIASNNISFSFRWLYGFFLIH